MIDQRKATSFCALTLCKNIFHWGAVEGGISYPHICGIFFKSHLFGDLFPPFFGRIRKKSVISGHHHWAGSKESWSSFPRKQIEFGLVAPSCKTIYPNSHYPTKECHKWWCSIRVRLHLCCKPTIDLGKVFMNSMLNMTRAKFLEVASADHPLWQDVLHSPTHAYPFMWSEYGEHFINIVMVMNNVMT